jgi:hypothetical protein
MGNIERRHLKAKGWRLSSTVSLSHAGDGALQILVMLSDGCSGGLPLSGERADVVVRIDDECFHVRPLFPHGLPCPHIHHYGAPHKRAESAAILKETHACSVDQHADRRRARPRAPLEEAGRHSQVLSSRPLGTCREMRSHQARRKLAPQPQPHFIRGPDGRPHLTFELFPGRSPLWDPAGRLGHIVKCPRILRPVSWAPQPQPHFIRGPRGRPMRLNVGSCSNFLT